MVGSFRQWLWELNKILRLRNRSIIVTARFDRVKHVVNVERDEPSVDRNLLLTPLTLCRVTGWLCRVCHPPLRNVHPRGILH